MHCKHSAVKMTVATIINNVVTLACISHLMGFERVWIMCVSTGVKLNFLCYDFNFLNSLKAGLVAVRRLMLILQTFSGYSMGKQSEILVCRCVYSIHLNEL